MLSSDILNNLIRGRRIDLEYQLKIKSEEFNAKLAELKQQTDLANLKVKSEMAKYEADILFNDTTSVMSIIL